MYTPSLSVEPPAKMKEKAYIILILCVTYGSCHLLLSSEYYHGNISDESLSQNNEPLILTPLINKNEFAKAKNSAKVTHADFFNKESYSGFFTVDETHNSNLFFWFFPAETDPTKAPLIIWLQGGPGDSSLTGLFVENGPFKVISESKIDLRGDEERWTKDMSILYIDSPVGTGYSFTDPGGYVKDQTTIGNHLYEALQQFFKVFSDYKNCDLYIAGESYGAKYAVSLAKTIHNAGPNSATKVNLKGLALDSGFTDPENMMIYSEFLYQTGLIDTIVKGDFATKENGIVQLVKNGNLAEAHDKLMELLKAIRDETGLNQLYNFLNQNDPTLPLIGNYIKYVKGDGIRQALHVGDKEFYPFSTTSEVYTNLREDYMKSVAPWISELLDNYRILFYNGQVDIEVAYPLLENSLQNLDYSKRNNYNNAKRDIWRVNNVPAGYVKKVGNLMEVMVRKGGHLLVHDRSQWCRDLVSKFVKNQL